MRVSSNRVLNLQISTKWQTKYCKLNPIIARKALDLKNRFKTQYDVHDDHDDADDNDYDGDDYADI